MRKKLIGANITVYDLLSKEKNKPKIFYASLGKYNEKTDCDGLGVHDMNIFHYFDNLKDLKQTVGEEFSDGYKLLNYELVYR